MIVRGVRADDVSAVRSLVDGLIFQTSYAELVATPLDRSLDDASDESRAIVLDAGGAIEGVGIYGRVAGAVGAGKLHFIGVRESRWRLGHGRTLLREVVRRLGRAGARFIHAELPDDPAIEPAKALLIGEQFIELGRVPDLFRDGIDLVLYSRQLTEERVRSQCPTALRS